MIVLAATQKPEGQVVPTGIRDLFGVTLALRCNTWQASDTILGSGQAAAGHDASTVLASQRGVGYLRAEGLPQRIRTYHLTDADVERVVAEAVELRGLASAVAVPPSPVPPLPSYPSSLSRSSGAETEGQAPAAPPDPRSVAKSDDSDAVDHAGRAIEGRAAGQRRDAAPLGAGAGRLAHGHARAGKRSPTYESWRDMKQRCLNPRSKSYVHYGGRGIAIDPRWTAPDGAGFAAFLADLGERPAAHTLDRIDVDGPYTASNCKWSTPVEQRANRRDSGPRAEKATEAAA